MKPLLISLIVLASSYTFSQKNALFMETSQTYKVEISDNPEIIITKAAHVVPSEQQYTALKNEFIAFIHFGPNTFSGLEWGTGKEDPSVFKLENLDTDQWCEAMTSAGMKMVILTVKHHDGFTLWQSRYTKHGIMSTGFKNGKGDILKELSESCQKYGLKLGVYLSPADLFQIENASGLYGNLSEYSMRTIPRAVAGRPFKNPKTFKFLVDDYNEYFLNQLFELLTEYGPIHEVWFDGAHPKRKGGQKYNYLAWKELIKNLAPQAVIFGKEDIRWCGNESGKTRDTEWNVIPYQDNPSLMNRFGDLTADSLGHRSQLYQAKYLHYQQAETNTSIREGWFYKDDTHQKVRSADDVFDIYERSVGGNSTFLLNIPPNKEGKFSPEDVKVLTETGKRIKDTYSDNLLKEAQIPDPLTDTDPNNPWLMVDNILEIRLPRPITMNRFVVQEAIKTHSERVEEFQLEAWLGNEWKVVSKATNIGYKRILRFPEISTHKLRLKILSSRLTPALSSVSAHYYKARPPYLSLKRDLNGYVTISPKEHDFNWKPHGENARENINIGSEIRYSLDGSLPNKTAHLYKAPFFLKKGKVQARVFTSSEAGSITTETFGIIKKDWKPMTPFSPNEESSYYAAFDANPSTYWLSNKATKEDFTIDLGKTYQLKGFAYTPHDRSSKGMIEHGDLLLSKDGKSWVKYDSFVFGNLINNPSKRYHYFDTPTKTRYIKIRPTQVSGTNAPAVIAELDFF